MRRSWASMLVAGAMAATIALTGCGEGMMGGSQQDGGSSTTVTTTDTNNGENSSQNGTNQNSSSQNMIGEDEAKRIAFEDADVREQDVTMLSVWLDADDAVPAYEVDFNVGTTEYDYEINAETGAIIERGIENNN